MVFVVLGLVARTILAQGNRVRNEYSYLGSMDAIRPTITVDAAILGATSMIFVLGFSIRAGQRGPERSGLTMTILAIGACMIIIVAAKPNATAPRAMRPLLAIGERSQERDVPSAVTSFFH